MNLKEQITRQVLSSMADLDQSKPWYVTLKTKPFLQLAREVNADLSIDGKEWSPGTRKCDFSYIDGGIKIAVCETNGGLAKNRICQGYKTKINLSLEGA